MLITFEGVEGVGKSTHVRWLSRYLTDRGHTVCCTREPGGTPWGESIRDMLLDPARTAPCPETELLLMMAARMEHVRTLVQPQLGAGAWVISDRLIDASFAYQGGGRGVDEDRIQQLADWCLGDLTPDCTFLLDAPWEVTSARVAHRGRVDRFEQEQRAFFERVQAAYRRRACQHPDRIHVLDATRSIASLRRAMCEVLGLPPPT